MKEVARYLNQTEADLAKCFLEEQGIPAFVENDNLGHLYFYIGTSIGSRLMVLKEEDQKKAKQLLAENDFHSTIHRPTNYLKTAYVNLIFGTIMLVPPFAFLALFYSVKAFKQFPQKRGKVLLLFFASAITSTFWTLFFLKMILNWEAINSFIGFNH